MSRETEREQLQLIKSWLKENWQVLVLGLLLGGGISGGWSGWNYYQSTSAQRGAEEFAAFQEQSLQFFQVLAQEQNLSDAEQQSYAALQRQADSLIADNAGKLYGDMTALLAARAAVEMSDYQRAASYLDGVYSGSNELAISEIARLRLATVYWQQDENDAALDLLQRQPIAPEFASLFAELSGDIRYSQGQIGEAYAFYQEASRLQNVNQASPLLNLKINKTAPARPSSDIPE